MNPTEWLPVSGSPNYQTSDGKFVAVYRFTDRGHAIFWTFPSEQPKRARILRNALSVGGLPDFKAWVRK